MIGFFRVSKKKKLLSRSASLRGVVHRWNSASDFLDSDPEFKLATTLIERPRHREVACLQVLHIPFTSERKSAAPESTCSKKHPRPATPTHRCTRRENVFLSFLKANIFCLGNLPYACYTERQACYIKEQTLIQVRTHASYFCNTVPGIATLES